MDQDDRELNPAHGRRADAPEDTSLREWFVPTEEVPVPAGFASRVARLAFEGAETPREEDVVLTPAGPGGVTAGLEQGRILSFTMSLAAAAAAAVIVFSLILAGADTSDATADQGISADTSLEEKLELLEAENRDLESSRPGSEEADAR